MNALSAFDELDVALRKERKHLLLDAGCVLAYWLIKGTVMGFGFCLGILLGMGT